MESKEAGKFSFPSSEISTALFESARSTITTACIATLGENGVVATFCGRDHMPKATLVPVVDNFNRLGVIKSQIGMSPEFCDQLWARIVQAKILNQAECVRLCGGDPSKLIEMAECVRPGDPDNREAHAARAYFDAVLHGTGRWDGPYTEYLNYGYSVPKSIIAQELFMGGWIVELGIHHKGRENNFNLVYDLIEPFRPLLDLLILTYDLTGTVKSDKKNLLHSSMGYFMRFDKKRYTAQRCAELMADSFKRAVQQNDPDKLILPELIELALPETE